MKILFGVVIALHLLSFSVWAEANSSSDNKPRLKSPIATHALSTVSAKPSVKVPTIGAEEPPSSDVIEEQVQVINYANSRLRHLRWNQRNCIECYVANAGDEDSTLAVSEKRNACIAKWTDFYDKEPIDPKKPDGPRQPVDVRIVLGYLDSDVNPSVSDGVMRESIVADITAACDKDNLVRVCGFKESVVNDEVFEKQVEGPSGEMQTVRVTLTASSASSLGGASTARQEKQREHASRVFYDGLKESDMVLYVGHARFGWGPDFGPAVRRKDGTIDKEHYTKKLPGLRTLTGELQKSAVNGKRRTAKIIGFFACDAGVWREQLERIAPNSGLLLSGTDKVRMQTALGMAYLALDSVLWQRCADEFNRAMNTLGKYREPLKPVKLRRFFPEK